MKDHEAGFQDKGQDSFGKKKKNSPQSELVKDFVMLEKLLLLSSKERVPSIRKSQTK